MSKKGLVLCGGGAKGAYQIGALKALKELGFKPDIVTGTSVGALNACFAVEDDIELGIKVWSNIDMESIFSFTEKQKDISKSKSMVELTASLIKSGESASYEPLMKLIEKIVDEDKIRKSNIEYGFVTTQFMPLKKIEIYKDDIPYGQIKDYVMASAACYPYMKSYTLNDKMYIDGGYFDNMPIDMVIKKGATDIVVVDLKGIGKLSKSSDLVGNITYVESRYDLGGIMLFDANNSKKNMKLGYLDTLKAFDKYEGSLYTFKLGENIKSSKYQDKVIKNYKKIYTSLPLASSLENLSRRSVEKYLNDFNKKIFNINSNVLSIEEICASTFKIDYLKVYTFKKLMDKIVEEKENFKIDNKKIKNARDVIKRLAKTNRLKAKLELLDKRNIVMYISNLLKKDILTTSDKKEIWFIGGVMPDVLLSALFISILED